jgi:ABC-type ATPase involved in cell division
LVRFENVGLRYGLGPEILRDLSFLIPAHSFQFLTGPSGAGKTSLLRLLFLSLRPTRGLVNLFGHDVSMLGKDQIADLRKRIGIVLQDFRLLDHMTTYENGALFRVMGREERSHRKEVMTSEMGQLGSGWMRCCRSCPAARSSARRSRAPRSRGRSCCWRTSRPATSIRRWGGGCCGCSSN